MPRYSRRSMSGRGSSRNLKEGQIGFTYRIVWKAGRSAHEFCLPNRSKILIYSFVNLRKGLEGYVLHGHLPKACGDTAN